MSAPSFTPGPWETERCGTTYYNGPEDAGEPCIVTAPDNGVILAVCVPDVVPQVEANARLIAAAPELYEALSDIMENSVYQVAIGGNPNMVDGLMARANAALAKARGEA